MNWSYTAYGLALHSTFRLPGMQEAPGRGLPSLALHLKAPEELAPYWPMTAGPPSWSGRMGDGRRLAITRGRDGDLLFTHGLDDRFRLNPSEGVLWCAPRDIDRLDWRRVLINRVLPNASIAYGREALHASAVETGVGVVGIAAPSGAGKSSLAGELVRRGWPLFGDDVLVLDRGPEGILAQPAGPHMNLPLDQPATHEVGVTLGILGDERWIAASMASSKPREISAIVLLERGAGVDLEVEVLPRSPLGIAPFMIGLPEGNGRDASRFALYADLVESARLLRLSAGLDHPPAALAECLEAAFELSSDPLAAGAR